MFTIFYYQNPTEGRATKALHRNGKNEIILCVKWCCSSFSVFSLLFRLWCCSNFVLCVYLLCVERFWSADMFVCLAFFFPPCVFGIVQRAPGVNRPQFENSYALIANLSWGSFFDKLKWNAVFRGDAKILERNLVAQDYACFLKPSR